MKWEIFNLGRFLPVSTNIWATFSLYMCIMFLLPAAVCPVVLGFRLLKTLVALRWYFSSWWGCYLFDIFTISTLVIFKELRDSPSPVLVLSYCAICFCFYLLSAFGCPRFCPLYLQYCYFLVVGNPLLTALRTWWRDARSVVSRGFPTMLHVLPRSLRQQGQPANVFLHCVATDYSIGIRYFEKGIRLLA